jgi:UDP-N-acetylmuramoyl-tripeptide--D-alanyl-D-alanine ligase
MAERFGVARLGIARALAGIAHVRHRLEPKVGDGGITILDDAFNSNPTGAAVALEVLASAKGGRRILVTPGMIELGDIEIEANYRFGKQAAKSSDLAVLIGVKRIEPIRKGLVDAGMSPENIWVASTLTEGLEQLKGYLKSGDVMLLENDLPDQYAGM